MKNQYRRGGLSKKGGLGQFVDLKGGLARKRLVMFLRGVDAPMLTTQQVCLESGQFISFATSE